MKIGDKVVIIKTGKTGNIKKFYGNSVVSIVLDEPIEYMMQNKVEKMYIQIMSKSKVKKVMNFVQQTLF